MEVDASHLELEAVKIRLNLAVYISFSSIAWLRREVLLFVDLLMKIAVQNLYVEPDPLSTKGSWFSRFLIFELEF